MALVERSELVARDGQGAALLACVAGEGAALLRAVPGVLSVRFGRGVEHPDHLLLLVEWVAMEDHAAFNRSPASPALRALLLPLTASGAMEHFVMDDAA